MANSRERENGVYEQRHIVTMASARFFSVGFALCSAFVQPQVGALTVTAPPSGASTLPAGDDFATQMISDPWDMENLQDIDTDESTNLTAQTFSSGLFSATASACAASFWPQFTGYGSQIVAVKRGPRYPIDTAVYRYFTIKFKTSTAQQDRVLFFKNGDTSVTGNYGSSVFQSAPTNQWTIHTWDLYNDVYTTNPYFAWTSFSQVQGIRFDPCNSGSPTIQVDWIRLTAPPSASQRYTVTWSDTVGTTYTLTAIDNADNSRFQLDAGVSGSSDSVDMSRLAPGNYRIEVSRSSPAATATSPGLIHINAPPQVALTAPSIRGEIAQSYAVTELGGQWGPIINGTIFQATPNFANISYAGGVFSGRPTTFDPQFIMKTTGHPINASLYRSACFKMQVFGTRDVGTGSVARLFWANSSGVTTTKDIVLDSGLNEYCMPDLADTTVVPLDSGGPWTGSLDYFRMDPHEFPVSAQCTSAPSAANCHDVQLNSISVSPFATANPNYTFAWTLADADNGAAVIDLYLDPDTNPDNGNEILIHGQTAATGSGQFVHTGSGSVPSGTYHALIVADDGYNAVSQYAGGPIIVTTSDEIFGNGFEQP